MTTQPNHLSTRVPIKALSSISNPTIDPPDTISIPFVLARTVCNSITPNEQPPRKMNPRVNNNDPSRNPKKRIWLNSWWAKTHSAELNRMNIVWEKYRIVPSKECCKFPKSRLEALPLPCSSLSTRGLSERFCHDRFLLMRTCRDGAIYSARNISIIMGHLFPACYSW
ncbi:hypothetical protein CDAR_440731 [Caerostris darwini]|uniref:Uncharacterized protein n=1 Tax=Caerostris darwini TaxID=1538125 RepID=A0AAV4MMK3_9ARAC|nr:hypothetical protein CDAR_440731 [Caerostris darwini]